MLRSGASLRGKRCRGFPQFEHKRAAVETVRQIQTSVSVYLGTITIINTCLGAGAALILYLLDMPNPILFGVMVGMLNFAPYIGPIVSGVLLLFISSLNFAGLTQVLLPPFLVMVLNVLEGQFITPTVAGHRLALSPVAVFLSILLWGWMWGVVGILIAVPLRGCRELGCDPLSVPRPGAGVLGGGAGPARRRRRRPPEVGCGMWYGAPALRRGRGGAGGPRAGTGVSRAGRPRARATARSRPLVDTSSPSAARNTRPAAAGWSRQVTSRSTRLSIASRLRRLFTAPSGNGTPRCIQRSILWKLAFTPGP